MKRREFSLASLGTAASLGGLSLNNTAFAQGPAKFVAGKDYTKLDRAVPTESEAGKIEVIEFFLVQLLSLQRLRTRLCTMGEKCAQGCGGAPHTRRVQRRLRAPATFVFLFGSHGLVRQSTRQSVPSHSCRTFDIEHRCQHFGLGRKARR